MKFKFVLASSLAVVLAAPVLAADNDSEDGEKKEKVICRSERATGSLARKTRVCLTQSQWDELNAKTRKDIDDFTTRGGNREGAGQAQ
jgi:hypothetical protein